MLKPIKYVVYFKSKTLWQPLYLYKSDGNFRKRMDSIARYSLDPQRASALYLVRVRVDFDGSDEWFTVRFNQNGLGWELVEADQSYIEREGLDGESELVG